METQQERASACGLYYQPCEARFLSDSQPRLERRGFQFIWGYSAYRVCVWYDGPLCDGAIHVGTYSSQQAYAVPRAARQDMYDLLRELRTEKRGQ